MLPILGTALLLGCLYLVGYRTLGEEAVSSKLSNAKLRIFGLSFSASAKTRSDVVALFEPASRLESAWRGSDEVSGTVVGLGGDPRWIDIKTAEGRIHSIHSSISGETLKSQGVEIGTKVTCWVSYRPFYTLGPMVMCTHAVVKE
ncbi:hypothetical protein [Roseimicrobium gellanilyticum]|nr:hypothetical protein [Roseimicrobium gellanilyticum]